MNHQPLVTVAVPSYNHGKYIQECIRSIIDQDYEHIELIIIDDGSRDDSVSKIYELTEECKSRFKRFKFIHRENRGLCNTLNEALDWSEGVYFSPSASDDVLFQNKISAQVRVLEREKNNRVVGVLSGISIFNESKEIVRVERGIERKVGFKEVFTRTVPLPGQASMIQTKSLKRIGGYNSNYKVEDYFVFLELTKIGNFLFSSKDVVLNYRRHDENLSSREDIMWNAIHQIIQNYKCDPNYNQALANSMIIHANSIYADNPYKSFKWLLNAIMISNKVWYFRGVYTLLGKLFLPRMLFAKLRKLFGR